MSLEDLENVGLLLPRDQWGKPFQDGAPRLRLSVIGLTTVLGAGLMYSGDGRLITWVGLGIFFLALAAFTVLSLRAIR